MAKGTPSLARRRDRSAPSSNSKTDVRGKCSTTDDAVGTSESEYELKREGKRVKKPLKKRSVRKTAPDATPMASLSLSTPADHDSLKSLGLDGLAVKLDDSTPILNRFIAFVQDNHVHTDTSPVYTPNFDTAEHVLDMPFYDPVQRKFELLVNEVALYDHEMASGEVYRAWRLRARNVRKPDLEAVELFQMHTSIRDNERCMQCKASNGKEMAYCNVQPGVACDNCADYRDPADCIRRFNLLQNRGVNIITENICSESQLDKVVSLGQIKVDVMNRAPMELNISAWKRISITAGKPAPVSHDRVFIDTVSLVTWKQKIFPSVDLGKLGYNLHGEWQTIWSRIYYGASRAAVHNAKSVLRAHPPACWIPAPPSNGVNSLKYVVSYTGIDLEKANALEDLASYRVFALSQRDSEDDQIRAATRVLENIMFTMTGLVGSLQGLRNIAYEKRRAFLSIDEQEKFGAMVTRGQYGPYNGSLIWSRPKTYRDRRNVRMVPGTAVLKDLRADPGASLGEGISFETVIRDRACLAYIQQESLNAIARGEGLIKAIFAAQVSAQYLELGVLTKADVLQQYCVCSSLEMKAATEHMCMSCNILRPCTNMVLRETPDGLIMECCGCGSRNTSSQRSLVLTTEGMVIRRVDDRYRRDAKVHDPPCSKAELIEAIVESYLLKDDQTAWKDAYSSKVVGIVDATYPPEANIDVRLAFLHPCRMSIEKPLSRWLRSDMKVALHDPANIALTKDCINRLKGNSAPSALPLLKKALQLKMAVSNQPPCAGYQPSVAAPWAILERAFDSQRLIDKLEPRGLRARVRKIPSEAEFCVVRDMQISGIWDGRSIPKEREVLRTTFMFRFEHLGGEFGHMPCADMWTDEEWSCLLGVVSQIENDRSPNGFNKYCLPKLPRCGSKNVPWLWKRDTCPKDVDKEFIFNEFRARLHTMTTACNRNHKTDESPATLFVEYVVQWFETGGKCHLFGFTMTAYCGHITNFSFGRGITQKLEDGSIRLIKPGERMQTGCKVLLPANVWTDYDITQRTIVAESWKANAFRFCYPVSECLIDILEKAVLDLVDSCKWYQSVGKLEDYPRIPLPEFYKDRKAAWIDAFLSGSEAIGEDGHEAASNDMVLEDPEVTAYEIFEEEIRSAQDGEITAENGGQAGNCLETRRVFNDLPVRL